MRFVIALLRYQRGSVVTGVAKAALAIGLLSLVAANLVSERLDRDRLAQLAHAAVGGRGDPQVTGSILPRDGAIRLDPCAAPR